MESNLDRLKKAYADWNGSRGASRDAWAALMGDHFQLRHVDETSQGLGFARDSATREEAMRYLAAIFIDWEMVHYTPEHYVCEGDRIAMFGRSAFRNRGTGKVADLRMACLWEFSGDRAVSLTEIVDSAVAVAAATP